jgi:3-dehydroquinate dehydratase-1
MDNIVLRGVELGSVPRVVAIIDRMVAPEKVHDLVRHGCDMLEIRADLFAGSFDETLAYLGRLRTAVAVPVIGTLRETPGNRDVRLDMFRRLVPLVDCVDIEIDTSIAGQVIAAAREAKVAVMVSEHDFDKTPDIAALTRIVDTARGMGARIVKIAAMARTSDDVTRLLRFAQDNRDGGIVAISMGEYGMVSRVLAPLFGSLLSYGFVEASVAPGQVSALELVGEMARYFPQRRARR